MILPTLSALAIWTCEITGQISDGMWENSGPQNHYVFWCHLNCKFDSTSVPKVVTNVTNDTMWCKKTGYNLAGLYEYVGGRMLTQGRMGRALERCALAKAYFTESGEFIQSEPIGEHGYRVALFEQACDAGEVLNKLGTIEKFEERMTAGKLEKYDYEFDKLEYITRNVAAAFFATKYEMKDLRADVKVIKEAMKTARA